MYLHDARGWQMAGYKLRKLMGLNENRLGEHDTTTKIIDGTVVYCLSAENAANRKPRSLRPHRIWAICPVAECEQHVPAGRLQQHLVVHEDQFEGLELRITGWHKNEGSRRRAHAVGKPTNCGCGQPYLHSHDNAMTACCGGSMCCAKANV